jgi:hypothetical protein
MRPKSVEHYGRNELTLQRQFPTIARRAGDLARRSFRSQKNRESDRVVGIQFPNLSVLSVASCLENRRQRSKRSGANAEFSFHMRT